MKRFVSVLLIIILVMLSVPMAGAGRYHDGRAHLATTQSANVNVRQKPDKNSKRLAQIKKANTEMLIIGEEFGDDDYLWYYVCTKKGTKGYVRSDKLESIPAQKENEHYGLPVKKLATRDGPSMDYADMGTYSMKEQFVKILGKAYDSQENCWWVKCLLCGVGPNNGEDIIAWAKYDSFDEETVLIDYVPEESEPTPEPVEITPEPVVMEEVLVTPEPVMTEDEPDEHAEYEPSESEESEDSEEIVATPTPAPVEKKIQDYESDPEEVVTDAETQIDFIANEILVMAKKGVSEDEVSMFADSMGGVIVGNNEYLREYQILLSTSVTSLDEMEKVKQDFMDSGLFTYCFANTILDINPEFTPNDSEWSNWSKTVDKHWGIDAIRAPEMWEAFDLANRDPIRVGILDNQFYIDHEDLVFKDVYEHFFDPTLGDTPSHGTHVAGIIAATFNNKKGIAGIAPNSELYCVSLYGLASKTGDYTKVGVSESGMPVSFFLSALTYLICIRNCRVINMSYGLPDEIYNEADVKFMRTVEEPIIVALREFLDEGLDFLIVKAAGNERKTNELTANAGASILSEVEDWDIKSRIIVVGAVEKAGNSYQMCDFSSYGDRVDIVAPGGDIYSAVYSPNKTMELFHNYNGYDYMSGTSMATPYVTGVAAAMLTVNPNLTGQEVKKILMETATGSYTYADTKDYYYPMLDAYAAVEKASSYYSARLYSSWNKAYKDFVMNKIYEKIGYPDFLPDYCDVEATMDGSYNLVKTDNDFDPIWFTLFDFDDDGIPELLAFNGYGVMASNSVNIYTFRNHRIKHVGSVGSGELSLNYDYDRHYPGIVEYAGTQGYYYTMYYYMENDQIHAEKIESEDYWSNPDIPEPDLDSEPVITRETDNLDLYNWAVGNSAVSSSFATYTYEQIAQIGWDQFVKKALAGEGYAEQATPTPIPTSTTVPNNIVISDQWQDIFINDDIIGKWELVEENLFTITGDDLANMPAETVLGRYTFSSKYGKTSYLATISKPKIPTALENRLRERGEVYLLYRITSSNIWATNLLMVFPQSKKIPVTYGYEWGETESNVFIGLGFGFNYWDLLWDKDTFYAMSLNNPPIKDFAYNDDTEPSLFNQVDEYNFPIPDKYVKELLKYIP